MLHNYSSAIVEDRSRIHVICCQIQFGDSSILMATRAFRVVPGHRQIGESLWTGVTLPKHKRNQLGMKVQHSWLNSILLNTNGVAMLMPLLSCWVSLTAFNWACLSSGVSFCLLCCWASLMASNQVCLSA